MDIIRWSISRPVSITVAVLLVVLFGLISLTRIPIQLTPTVDRGVVTVSTNWPGRSPDEVVDEITREQEKRLKNITNLKTMRSISSEGGAQVTLEFYIGTDLARALQEVSDALRQVPNYPDDADEPVITASEGSDENAITWMILDLEPGTEAAHPDFDISTLFDAVDRDISPILERIDGVSAVNVFGGREREVQVLVDELALAQRGLNHLEVAQALRAENRNISAGTIAEGKRDYRVRTTGQFRTEEDVLSVVLAYREGRPVYVRDVATVRFDHAKPRSFVRSFGKPSLAINCLRQSGANVMAVMADVRARVEQINREVLPRLHPDVGPDLRLRLVYDETTYIQSAVDLVIGNVWFGGALASLALLVFLRSVRATLIIALAIPVSIIGTFLVMNAMGRTLNVISLAGLAFATGMVVDNGIVVLENIYRRLQMGDAPREAAYRGGREVWTAILASTLTTIGVFVPVLTIQEEAGQLFRDIVLAVAVAVTLSLPISITLVPSAAAHWLSRSSVEPSRGSVGRVLRSVFGLAPIMDRLTGAFVSGLRWAMSSWRGWTVRPAVIIGMTAASLWGASALRPPLDYLPTGNQNLAFGILLIPPGYSVEHKVEVAKRVEAVVKPYADAEMDDPASLAALPPIKRLGFGGLSEEGPPFEPVAIENFFAVGFSGGMFAGAQSEDPQRVIPVTQVVSNAMQGIPGTMGFASQMSIFRGAGSGNTVDLEISGPDLGRVLAAATAMRGMLQGQGYFQIQPSPQNFDLMQPEWQVRVNQTGRELGLRPDVAGQAVRSLFDGAFVDEFLLGEDMVDMVLLPSRGRLEYKEQFAGIPVSTPAGPVVPLDSVVDVVEVMSPQDVLRVEELPSVTLSVSPPQGQTVEEVMTTVREKVVEPSRAMGLVDSSMRVRMEGTAAKLDEVRHALLGEPTVGPASGARRAGWWLGVAVGGVGLVGAGVSLARSVRGRRRDFAYGALGIALTAVTVGGLVSGLALHPEFLTARFIWALAVTYLLMCSLFESFLYPLVIMFSVPLAMVGGFAGLRLVHNWSMTVPTMQPQNLDVLTMLGFIILIGTVVNNAILLVEQALNFMNPVRHGGDEPPLSATDAVAKSVRTRMRPIFMTTLTTVTGLIPLVIAPGAGSEMYRGLGAVVLGGLVVSTVFTLVLVPMVFSLTMQVREGMMALRRREPGAEPIPSVA